MSENKTDPTGRPIEAAGRAENVGFSEFTNDRLNVWKKNIDKKVYALVTADYRGKDRFANYAQVVNPNVKLPFTGEMVKEMSETWYGGSRETIVDKDGKVVVTFKETGNSLQIVIEDKKDYKGREALFQEIVCAYGRTQVDGYLLDGEDVFFETANGYSLDKSGSAWFRANFCVLLDVKGEEIVRRDLFAHDDRRIETTGDTYQKTWVTRNTQDNAGVVRAGLAIHKEGEFALPPMEVVGQKA